MNIGAMIKDIEPEWIVVWKKMETANEAQRKMDKCNLYVV